MHILHIASELAPIAKVGGLADVLLGLNRELSWKGHDVDILIPKYDCIDAREIRDFSVESEVTSFFEGKETPNSIWMGWVENLKVYFIEPHHPRYFFNRSCFYGCEDDVERFLYFSRACFDYISKKNEEIDIIHLHDWQSAIIAPLFYELFQSTKKRPKIVFTIHNLEHQGKCAPFNLDQIGLSGAKMMAEDKLQDLLYPETINLLKGGIVYSDFVTTVSPNYAWEVTTIEGGRGLDSVIRQFQHKFKGILNGVDYSYWNPEVDRYLPAHFSYREVPASKKDHSILDTKAFIKKVLREWVGLAEEHRPLIGCIARLVPQKGIDMIKHVIMTIADRGGQFILLGSSPITAINEEFHKLKKQFRDNPHVHLMLQHQEQLAHMIFAGSDQFIIPSIFEPCGLTQLIAMKYGTIPVARNTGGLADTVFDVDYSSLPEEMRNGYVFNYPDNQGIDSALDRAIDCWYNDPNKWRKLMMRVMQIDHSWDKPSEEYLQIYKKL